jgi:selenocysteine lyase/cysteine desulfurase
MEHNSVVRPLHRLSQSGVSVEKVWASKEGVLDPLKIRAAITSHTKLIAMTHASNVIGTITPLAEVVEIAHARGIPVLLDAAQTAGTLPIAVHDLGLDLLACPGHKGLYGPQGTGFLYVAPRIDLRPLLYGGTGSRSDVPEMPDFLPDRFEAGTVNTPGIAGLGAGIEFLISTGIDNVRAHEVALNQCLLEGLKAIEGAEVFGVYDAEKRASVILFNILGIDCGAIGDQLDTEFEIACRVGIHCAPDAHRTLGIFPRGGIRLSPGFFNTPDDIDCALDAIRTIAHHKPELWTPPKSSSSKALTSL